MISNTSDHLPRHIAIIMDGNGRWARKRGLPRTAGHRQGAEAARRIVKSAGDLGVSYVTLFGFSSENWNRPDDEIHDLMDLLRYYLRSETAELHKNGAKLKVIGDRTAFDADIGELIENAESLTRDNTHITVCIALNYGGRHEIMEAARQFALQCTTENIEPDMAYTQVHFPQFLMTKDIPDPDILIRTSGELRISNFLLWQCAYAEMIFTSVLWPDFDKKHLVEALEEYASRDRRFGAVSAKKQI